ncbi:MAG TPA: hypothetical protein VEB65_02445 [Solirubrobacterales bacterium]|nr:hypothetical protein [Solirubrobacterales bacterium]
MTLQRLESRRGETWQGLWLAPLLTIVAQGFLLLALADENVGWLARAAVLVAALGASLAAAWSVLRAHAREVQYSEAIDAELAATADGDYADVRAAALPRPRRRRPEATPARPAAEQATDDPAEEPGDPQPATTTGPDEEGETAVVEPDPTPPPPAPEPREEREGWVARWDRHLVWWAAGETHAKSYMVWVAALGLFMLADVAVYLATV